MKSRLLFGFAVFLWTVSRLVAAPRDAAWQQVDEALRQGLPQTAFARLEPILSAALAEKGYAEAVRATCLRITLNPDPESRTNEARIAALQTELDHAPAAMKPVMEAILASWYWTYFQTNRWKIDQRTTTGAPSGPDLATWDLPHLCAEIERHFAAALADVPRLKATPIGDVREILTDGTVPDRYRPTLYDFLAHQALECFQSTEFRRTRLSEDFELEADSPVLADTAAFLAWNPVGNDRGPEPAPLAAIHLYQALLEFHQGDADPSAYYDADLARLKFGRGLLVGDDLDDRYRAALEHFRRTTAAHEISARATFELAELRRQAGEPKAAHDLALQGYHAFPASAGGIECYNLVQSIEAKSARLNTELVWNAPWPTIDVTYRNVSQVTFSAYPVQIESYLRKNGFLGYISSEFIDEVAKGKPALTWSATLPPTPDFRERTEKLSVPTSLKHGFYLILARHETAGAHGAAQAGAVAVWVSDLALVQRYTGAEDRQAGLVITANRGDPVAGARVRLWQQDHGVGYTAIAETSTDRDGYFEFTGAKAPYLIVADYHGDMISSGGRFPGFRSNDSDSEHVKNVFFTDRAIYRPGQTIHYAGVSIRYDQRAGKYAPRAKAKISIHLLDTSDSEVARVDLRTNEYGSFSGTFTAPRDRALGVMRLLVAHEEGQAVIRVEEYKRPKFQVALAAPAEAARLAAPVVVTGTATSYSGANLDGAEVRWYVTRSVMFPDWLGWREAPDVTILKKGKTITRPDGTFRLEFLATPDRKIPEKNEPTFGYSVHADVTDTTGETHSVDRVVRAGYTALKAVIQADAWQTIAKSVEITVSTTTLDWEPQAAAGTLKVSPIRQPTRVMRASRIASRDSDAQQFGAQSGTDPSIPGNWPTMDPIAVRPFTTDSTGKAVIALSLPAGLYRASVETKDRFGRSVTARSDLEVIDPESSRYTTRVPDYFSAPKMSVEPGETFTALWGTGDDYGRAFVEVEQGGKTLRQFWTEPGRTLSAIRQPVSAELHGGFTVHVTHIRENRAYLHNQLVQVPWSDRDLRLKWERFRSRLVPGQSETWTATVTGSATVRDPAEMVATLYDASLDQFAWHFWPATFDVFRQEGVEAWYDFQNSFQGFRTYEDWDGPSRLEKPWIYRNWTEDALLPVADDEVMTLTPFQVTDGRDYGFLKTGAKARGQKLVRSISVVSEGMLRDTGPNLIGYSASNPAPSQADAGRLALGSVTARRILTETAFFFPQLIAGSDGKFQLTFTVPEALTEWKFLGFAHDKNLRSGLLTGKAVTAKDLMVEPNPPRFVREGDALDFTVKVTNQGDTVQDGTVRLGFTDAVSSQAIDEALGNRQRDQTFSLPAKSSRTFSWHITVPDGAGVLTYKAVAASAHLSDGEEGFVPVLCRRVLVTESWPLSIRGPATKEFAFQKLLDSGTSPSLRHQALKVEMASQPAWYAVMALPYLIEYPYECSEQVFDRYYANTLARHLANSEPRIREVFDRWQSQAALDSPLEKNPDLKSVLIEETPWLREAKDESAAHRRVGLLFDAHRLDDESAHALRTLMERQSSAGLWSWFPGGSPSEYISLTLMTGFGRLRHLGVDVDVTPATKSLAALDAWCLQEYKSIQRGAHPEGYVPTALDALYLYGRSFFLRDQPVADAQRPAVDFLLNQAQKFWLRSSSRLSQGQLALALQRFGDEKTARAIVRSLKERSIDTAEMGMSWPETGEGWRWNQAPIETQAMMIEAFTEVTHDSVAVENCKIWLLKQKQTHEWKTTRATADAVYALLLQGDSLLTSDALVEVRLAGETLQPKSVEAGTGFYEESIPARAIKPAMGRVSVTKPDRGVSWGGVHWQYLEDVSRITPHADAPLRVKKTLWVKEVTAKGPVLRPVAGPVAVGEELVVRLELHTDRDLEYVHLKDARASGTEPVNVLSAFRYREGLGYYEMTRDTASHFFIENLPTGTYVFEYPLRAQLRGHYETGLAEIECMYAPEFNSHSESLSLQIE